MKSFLLEYRKRIQTWLNKYAFPEYSIFSIIAIIIGTVVGMAAVLFHNSIDFLNHFFFKQTATGLFYLAPVVIVLIPVFGMLLQALMIYISPKTARQKGVSEVIKSVAFRGGYIPLKTTIFHFIAPVICIGTGGTVGPEGPAAQLGGGLASEFGRWFGLSEQRRKIFTTAGAGAAIAAIFNTPIGGIFFALEIILLNDFQANTFSALILASVSASAISRIFLGNQSIFHFSHQPFADYSQLWIFILLGVVAGVISFLFIKYSTLLSRFFKKKILNRYPQWIVMAAVGIIVGISGFYYRDIFGIGYHAINEILSNSLSWKIVLILLVLKFLLVPLILHSGGFGGLFAPSLFIGAAVGYLFALILGAFGVQFDSTTIILVTMGALLGGINTIPISAILIIFEMTKDYSIILPLMLAVIMSTTIVQVILKGSVHIKHLEEEGYRIISGKESSLLKNIRVKNIKLSKIILLNESTPLPEIVTKLIENPQDTFYVTNNKGELSGTITETELRPIFIDYESVKDVIVARDIMRKIPVILSPYDDLDYVIRLFSKYNLDQFPVVENNKILGTVSRQEILNVYNRESLKFNLADGISSELLTLKDTEKTIISGYSLAEITATESLIGKTFKELRIRNKFGIEILMIKKRKNFIDEEYEIIPPSPEYRIERGDLLVVFGSDSKIEEFRKEIV